MRRKTEAFLGMAKGPLPKDFSTWVAVPVRVVGWEWAPEDTLLIWGATEMGEHLLNANVGFELRNIHQSGFHLGLGIFFAILRFRQSGVAESRPLKFVLLPWLAPK